MSRTIRLGLLSAVLLASCEDLVAPSLPGMLLRVSGHEQVGVAGAPLPQPLLVRLGDLRGRPIAGAQVRWKVTSGGGSVDRLVTLTDAAGEASTAWTVGDREENTVIASADGGASVAFRASSSTARTASLTTATARLSGRVLLAAASRSYGEWVSPPPQAFGGVEPRGAARDRSPGDSPPPGAPAPSRHRPVPRAERRLIVTYRAGSLGAPSPGSSAYISRAEARKVSDSIHRGLSRLASDAGARLEGVSPAILAARVVVDDPARLLEVRTRLARVPGVASVEPDAWFYRSGALPPGSGPGGDGSPDAPDARGRVVPNDPLYASQSWHYNLIDLPRAWRTTTGSEEVLVAIVDDGVRFDHPAIAANLTNDGFDFVSQLNDWLCGGWWELAGDGDGYDPDPTVPDDLVCTWGGMERGTGHGLHVAGTIGAQGGDGVGGTGVSWRVRIRPVRALGIDGGGSGYDIAQAILYAAGLPADDGKGGRVQASSGARIISMSLGGYTDLPILRAAVRAATEAGSLLIVAAGNENTSRPAYPAAYDEVVSVAAAGPYRTRAWYSNFGPTVDISAPGGDYWNCGSTCLVHSLGWNFEQAKPSYAYLQGTSMAAPHVAGVAALLLAAEPTLTRAELRDRLLRYAVDLGSPGRDDLYGHGLVNARNSLTRSFSASSRGFAQLFDARTGAVARTVPVEASSFEFTGVEAGEYYLFAGFDEGDDGRVGSPGRLWGAHTAGGRLTPVKVNGGGEYFTMLTVGQPNEVEPNDAPAEATRLVLGGYLHGRTASARDQDYYLLQVPAGTYTVETSGWNGDACGYATAEDTRLEWRHAHGQVLFTNDDIDAERRDYCSRITATVGAGTYILQVSGQSGRYYRIQARPGG